MAGRLAAVEGGVEVAGAESAGVAKKATVWEGQALMPSRLRQVEGSTGLRT